MRGCVTFLAFAAALIGVILWFALPPLAAAAVGAALASSGFDASETHVDVNASPPFEILAGRADSVRVTAVDARTGTVAAASVDVTLTDADLFGRNAASVDGTLTGVSVQDASGGRLTLADITVAGAPAAADAHMTIPGADLLGRVDAALGSAGVGASGLRAVPPDTLVARAFGREVRATVRVDASGVIVLDVPAVGVVPVLAPPPGLAARFLTVTVAADRSLVVHAIVDLRSLLGF